MEYSNEHGTTPTVDLQAHIKLATASEETQLLYSNTLTREKVLNERCTELEGLLSTARSASDANNNKAVELSAQRQAFEDMLQPLISYIGEQLIDSSSFNKDVERMVDDTLRDFTNDRDFINTVEEVVNGLNFQISVG